MSGDGSALEQLVDTSSPIHNSDFQFIEDKSFGRNARKSLNSFIGGGVDIRSVVTENDRVFVHLHNYEGGNPFKQRKPRYVVELSGDGELVGDLSAFSEMDVSRYCSIAVSPSRIFVHDGVVPPRVFGLKSSRTTHDGKIEELGQYERRIYCFSREDQRLEEIMMLRYSIGTLTADANNRLFGVSHGGCVLRLKGSGRGMTREKASTRIVELTLQDQNEEHESLPVVAQELGVPVKFWSEKDLFSAENHVYELFKTPEGVILHYNSQDRIFYGLNSPTVTKFDHQEPEHTHRTASSFVFLDDFVVQQIHEYQRRASTPYKQCLTLKAFAYDRAVAPAMMTSGFGWHSFLDSPQPLPNNSFVIKKRNRRDKPSLHKYSIEPITQQSWLSRTLLGNKQGTPTSNGLLPEDNS